MSDRRTSIAEVVFDLSDVCDITRPPMLDGGVLASDAEFVYRTAENAVVLCEAQALLLRLYVGVEGVQWCPVHRGIGGESPDDPTCDRFEFTASNDLAPKASRMPCDLRPLFYRQEPVTEET